MPDNTDSPFSALERVFHEPNRLAILSALAGAPDGLSFSELKETCGLTDGNLNRHLKALADADTVTTGKDRGKGRARTVVRLSDSGHEKFVAYLNTLEEVLQVAAKSVKQTKRSEASGHGDTVLMPQAG